MTYDDLVYEEILHELEQLRELDLGSEEYRVAVDGVSKLIDKTIDIKRLDQEAEVAEQNRKIETELKQKQMEDENLDRWVRNGIAIGGIILPLLVTIWGTKASFEFENEGTITTIMGRGFVNKLLPKK